MEAQRSSWREVCWLVFGCDGLCVIGVPYGLCLAEDCLQELDVLEGEFMEQCRKFSLQFRRDIVERRGDNWTDFAVLLVGK